MRTRFATTAMATAAAFACLLLMGSGIASADDPDILGLKYSEAKALISEADMTPVVATTVGDQLPQGQCRVVNASKVTTRNSSGEPDHLTMQLALTCYRADANANSPGFSSADLGAPAVAVREQARLQTRDWKQT